MKRIKMTLMALLAITAIGAVGASAASADGSGRVTIPAGGCDIEFTNTAWADNGMGGWGSETESVATLVGGDCDVDSVTGGAEINKYPIGEDGLGDATLDGSFSFRVIGGLVTCTYSASLSGDWHWTNHSTANPDPDIPHSAGNINNPGNPSVDDKMFHFSGTVTRISGSALFCPATSAADIDLRDHNTH